MTYSTTGTCASKIHFEIKDNKVYSVKFDGGCNGNLKGIGILVEGMDAKEVIEKFKGVKCGFKPTSCPEQLALALEKHLS
ncbi:MAG: TIGR03905 family TSCPD domain-containing protein [Treponemataceae bacterium]